MLVRCEQTCNFDVRFEWTFYQYYRTLNVFSRFRAPGQIRKAVKNFSNMTRCIIWFFYCICFILIHLFKNLVFHMEDKFVTNKIKSQKLKQRKLKTRKN